MTTMTHPNAKALATIMRPERKGDKPFAAYLYDNGDAAVWFERIERVGEARTRTYYWQIARGAVRVGRVGRGYLNATIGRAVLHDPGILHVVRAGCAVSWLPGSLIVHFPDAVGWTEFLCGPLEPLQVEVAHRVVAERVPFAAEDAERDPLLLLHQLAATLFFDNIQSRVAATKH